MTTTRPEVPTSYTNRPSWISDNRDGSMYISNNTDHYTGSGSTTRSATITANLDNLSSNFTFSQYKGDYEYNDYDVSSVTFNPTKFTSESGSASSNYSMFSLVIKYATTTWHDGNWNYGSWKKYTGAGDTSTYLDCNGAGSNFKLANANGGSAGQTHIQLIFNSSGEGRARVYPTTANPTTSDRTCSLTYGFFGITKTISIKQAAAEPYINIQENPSTTYSSRTGITEVSSNVTWTVSGETSKTWLTVTKIDNTSFKWSVNENTSSNYREATITVQGGGITKTCTFHQGGGYSIDITDSSISLNADDTAFTITVISMYDGQPYTIRTSNVSFSPNGIDAKAVSVNTYSSGVYVINCTASTNTSTTSTRSATAKVTGGGGKSDSVGIIQEKAPVIFSISPTSKTFNASGGTLTITVTSNVNWNVQSYPITLMTFSAATSNQVTFTINENTTIDERTGTVVITGGTSSRGECVVTQKAAAAYITIPSSVTTTYASGSSTISVSSNTNWTVSGETSKTWLTVSRSGNVINWSVNENTSSNYREATITVQGGGITKTCTFHQGGGYSLTINTPTVSIGHSQTAFTITVISMFDSSPFAITKTNVTFSPNNIGAGAVSVDTYSSGVYVINCTASTNTSTSTRSATATITQNATDGKSGTSTITQEAKPGRSWTSETYTTSSYQSVKVYDKNEIGGKVTITITDQSDNYKTYVICNSSSITDDKITCSATQTIDLSSSSYYVFVNGSFTRNGFQVPIGHRLSIALTDAS